MNKIKVLLTLLMGTLILFVSQRAFYEKSEELNSIYSDIIFTRLAVETQPYTRQIEYGLKNGKSLENFYDIQSVLSDAKRCCSYTNGAYIVSADNRLMYSVSDDEANLTVISVPPSADSVYSVYADGASRYILSVPILGREDAICGYLVLDVDSMVVKNTIQEYNNENIIQAAVIGILVFLAGAIAVIHLCRSERKIFTNCMTVTTVSICSLVALDSVISIYKLRVTLDSLIQQSVSKITMTLQNDLDTVAEKGVSLSRIYDLNTWLFESCRQVPFIETLIFDKNYTITAIISDDYSTGQIARYAALLAVIFAVCAAVGIALCFLGALVDKLINKRNNKGDNKNAENTKRASVCAE